MRRRESQTFWTRRKWECCLSWLVLLCVPPHVVPPAPRNPCKRPLYMKGVVHIKEGVCVRRKGDVQKDGQCTKEGRNL